MCVRTRTEIYMIYKTIFMMLLSFNRFFHLYTPKNQSTRVYFL